MTTERASRRTVAALVVAGLLASAAVSFRWTYEPDLWWHLAQGRELAAGRLPRTNLFSFTHPDYPQPATSWLFDLGAYALWHLGGATALQIAQTLVMLATLALVYAGCRQRSGVAASAAVVAFGLFVLEPRALPRPHTLSFAGMAACALLIERTVARRSIRPLLVAVPVFLVWGNLHVESLFGLAYLGCFALGLVLRPGDVPRSLGWRALGVVGACGAALLVNPYGFGPVRYLIDNARVSEIIRIAELQPPYLPNYAPFFAYACALVGVLPWVPRPRLYDVLAGAFFAVLAFRYLRFTPLLLCVTAPWVAARVATRVGGFRLAPLVALMLGLVLARVDPPTFVRQLAVGEHALAPAEIIPSGGVAFARQVGLAGRLFNSNNIGGYLIWGLYPAARVFQDGRLQAYPPEHFGEIMSASRAQDRWDELVAGVDWAMLSVPRPNELSGAGRFPARTWATVYFDEACEIVVRRGGTFATLVEPYEYRVLRPGFDAFAPLPRRLEDADRLVDEVRRNRRDDPAAFAPAAWLCLHGDSDVCAAAFAIAADRPELRRVALRLERMRTAAEADADGDRD